jgi:amidase
MHPNLMVRVKLMAAVTAVTLFTVHESSVMAEWSVEEKSISDLHQAFFSGATTAVDVVSQYAERILTYDDKPAGINAVGQINPNLLVDAAAVDGLIASGATTSQYPLLGVPVLIKDSYDVQGMITTNGVSVLNGSGTTGSTTLIAQNDAFSVARLKAAGAIIMGKANMSTMAYSFNGIDNAHGVVKNPYQPIRQPGGSSSGSGAGTAANFAMMAMGGETGGSIRIPSNANALVGLKTSLGLIDPGGTWPLTTARDVVGPMAKTVKDVAIAMNALVAPSSTNLFNGTPVYPVAAPGTVRPADYTAGLTTTSLQGKVLAVPKNMANEATAANPERINSRVLTQFNIALSELQSQGATIVYVDIPASVTNLTDPTGTSYGAPNIGSGVNSQTSWAAAYYYQKQIEDYNDPNIKNLRDFANALAAGRDAGAGSPFSTLNGAASNINTLALIWEAGNAKGYGDDNGDGMPDNPVAVQQLEAYANLRTTQYEAFMADPNLVDDPATMIDESAISIDAFVAPTYGNVMPYITSSLLPPGTPTDPYSESNIASLVGRFEANVLGNPALSVPMGYFPDGTPMGIQFFNELGGEADLLSLAYDYEQATMWRRAPDLAFAAVPEPASIAILGIGGLSALRRRRTA